MKRFLIVCATWIFSFSAAATDSIVADYETFKSWGANEQKAYVTGLRQAMRDLERDQKGFEYASNSVDFWDMFMPKAIAAGGTHCLVGGVQRPLNPKCSTRGRACGAGDNFKCGKVYLEKCVSREPIANLSDRCIAAAGDELPGKDMYNAARADIESIAGQCGRLELQATGCANFIDRTVKLGLKPLDKPVLAATPRAGTDMRTAAVQETGTIQDVVPDGFELGNTEVKNVPKLKDGGNGKGEGRPKYNAETPPPAAKNEGGCEQYRALGPLACVACGLHNSGADAKGVGKWVSMMGVMAQQFHGPYNTRTENGAERFQERVTDMIATYGYCTDAEFGGGGVPNQAGEWLRGGKINKKAVAQAYGFGDYKYAKALFDDGSEFFGMVNK